MSNKCTLHGREDTSLTEQEQPDMLSGHVYDNSI